MFGIDIAFKIHVTLVFFRFHLAVQLTFLLTEWNFLTKISRQASVKQLIALSLSFIVFADRNCFSYPTLRAIL